MARFLMGVGRRTADPLQSSSGVGFGRAVWAGGMVGRVNSFGRQPVGMCPALLVSPREIQSLQSDAVAGAVDRQRVSVATDQQTSPWLSFFCFRAVQAEEEAVVTRDPLAADRVPLGTVDLIV